MKIRRDIRISPWLTFFIALIFLLADLLAFADLRLNWPKQWAATPFLASLFIAPAIATCALLDLRRFGWNIYQAFAFVCALIEFMLACGTIYLRIHPN